MRFAIISDIHGNLPALDAVLEDAKRNQVESYIFVGDYCLSNPYPNECILRMRGLHNKYIVRGNEEKYLENLIGKDQDTWTDGQMQISYYCYRAVSKDNLDYLLSMPHRLNLRCNGVDLHIAHSSGEFISDCEHREWLPSQVAMKYKNKEITKESLRNDIHSYFDSNGEFQKILSELEQGIYIFGHSHVQWSYQSKDGRIVFINPGSCGLPLDGVKGSIPYTILDISDEKDIRVEEKRIPFDMEKYIDVLKKSDQFVKANVWSKIIEKELRTAREHLFFFLTFVEKYADDIGDKRRPFALDTWEKAYELWLGQSERLQSIRESERKSHIEIYSSEELYKTDSWLKKPIKTVKELLTLYEGYDKFRVLDLGSGVGRNSLFIADAFKDKDCIVECVDILDIAIEKLYENAKAYGVEKHIVGSVSTIEEYPIDCNKYDLIIAVSALEHVASEEAFKEKLKEIAGGICSGGIVCLVINSDVQEINKATQEYVEAQFEVNFETMELVSILKSVFADWTILKERIQEQQYDIPREFGISDLRTKVVTFVARKNV